MLCNNCKSEMRREYAFGGETPTQRLVCPQCKASTAPREILYDEDGNLSKESGKIIKSDSGKAEQSRNKPNKVNLKKQGKVASKK